MLTSQQPLNFPIRKTRSASKREITSTDALYKVPVLRTPRKRQDSETSSSDSNVLSVRCSPPKKNKDDRLDLDNCKTLKATLSSPAKRSAANEIKDTSLQTSPRKSPRIKENVAALSSRSPRKSPTKSEKRFVPMRLFPPDHDSKEMPLLQQTLSFAVRNTRSVSKCDSTSTDAFNTVPVLRTPSKQRQDSLSSSDPDFSNVHCSPSKNNKDDHLELGVCKTPTAKLSSPAKRLDVAEIKDTSPQISPRKSPRNKENGEALSSRNSRKSPRKSDKKFVPIRLFTPDLSAYQEAKRAFLTGSTSSLHCREAEIKVIVEFLEGHLINKKPGSLYISGAPGTGKTASLNQILQAEKFQKISHKCVFVNCTNMKQPQSIYERIYAEIASTTESSRKNSASDFQKSVTHLLSNSNIPILLILDEIDYLECKDQSILYSMFEWPALKNSKLVLIGIANALDLTDRTLPRLQIQPQFKPKLLHFPPYTKEQITTILKERVKEISIEAQNFIKPNALQFCARKVASVAGDIRKALDVCRRAVELVEGDVRRQQILQPRTLKSASPSKNLSKPKLVKCVDLPLIASILNDVYGNQMANGGQQDGNALPLQQKILLCSLCLIISNGKTKEVTLGKLHEVYSRICRKQQVTQVDLSEFTNLCNLVEARGLVTIKKNKNNRLTKVSLSVNESDLQFALQDKCLLATILTDTSCLSSNGKA